MENNQFTIEVFAEVGGGIAISEKDGNNIFKKIDFALSNGLNVVVSFQNIELIIAAFLNAAIGQLYSKYSSEELNACLQIINVSPEDKALFNMVTVRAKEYFAEKESYDVAFIEKINKGRIEKAEGNFKSMPIEDVWK